MVTSANLQSECSGANDFLLSSFKSISHLIFCWYIRQLKTFEGHITDKRLRYPSRYYVKEGNDTIMIWNR
jgi:hypothetical protein